MQWDSVDLVNFAITSKNLSTRNKPAPVDEATQARFQHGIQHEVSDFCS